jgi:hypothetical protein
MTTTAKPLFLLKKADDVPIGKTIYQIFDVPKTAEDWCASLNGDKKRYPTAYVSIQGMTRDYQKRGYIVLVRDEEAWEEEVVKVYEDLQRKESFWSAEAIRIKGIPVDRKEMRRCWTAHLQRLNERAKTKRKLPVQIDDGSADDI